MRSDPSQFELVAPDNLNAALALLAQDPGQWLPIAGGTDIMVQYAAGKLARRKLVSIQNLPELGGIEVLDHEIRVGAGCAYTSIREHATLAAEFPLLIKAARWTGGIANQNRGTLGGNIVNASPAADSLPALLVYDAELILVSSRGHRRMPYGHFHTAYKQMQLAPDELILSIALPRRFAGYVSFARKVGARSEQAISKVSIAALARVESGRVRDVRMAFGSVAPVPLRLIQTERLIIGKAIDEALIASARQAVAAEIKPIDDIRSSAKYRAAVAGNLVAEFLRSLAEENTPQVLALWNTLRFDEATAQILACGGTQSWARAMSTRRPFHNESSLAAASDEIWRSMSPSDCLEAFRSHPRIGEAPQALSNETPSKWARHEQSKVADADSGIKAALAEGNREYEKKFGHIFIVCATGKSAPEILEMLTRRMSNDAEAELREAAEQQRQITLLRLKKWLHS